MTVSPIPLDPSDPMARTGGVESVLEITVADAGTFRVSGPGAGGRVTAGAVYADLARLVNGERPILDGNGATTRAQLNYLSRVRGVMSDRSSCASKPKSRSRPMTRRSRPRKT